MQTSDKRASTPSVTVEIALVYQKAMTATTQHYQVMVAESKVKSELFIQDLKEMTGGMR